jgi:GTP-binding protein
VHLVAIGPEADPSVPPDPESAYETVRAELGAHGAGLAELPEIVVLSKRDLVTDELAVELVGEWRQRLGDRVLDVLAVSSATGAGLLELSDAIFAAVPPVSEGRISADERAAVVEPEFEAEHTVYQPAGDQGFDVEREDRAFRIRGRGIEQLVARHDLTNLEALAYLEGRLREIGVIAALERAGFEPGDEVRIGEEEFELDPGSQAPGLDT